MREGCAGRGKGEQCDRENVNGCNVFFSRVRVRAHYRDFAFFAVTSVTLPAATHCCSVGYHCFIMFFNALDETDESLFENRRVVLLKPTGHFLKTTGRFLRKRNSCEAKRGKGKTK